VGGWEKFQKQKDKIKKSGGGQGKKKFPKKNRDQRNFFWEGGMEKIKLQKKLRSRLIKVEKGQRKKNQPGMAHG